MSLPYQCFRHPVSEKYPPTCPSHAFDGRRSIVAVPVVPTSRLRRVRIPTLQRFSHHLPVSHRSGVLGYSRAGCPKVRGLVTRGVRLSVVLLSVVFTACTGGNLASAAATTSAPDAYVHSWHFSSNDGDGYSESGTVSVGEPEHFRSELVNGYQAAGNACFADPKTMPGCRCRILLTNSSQGESTVPSVGLSVDGGFTFRPTAATPIAMELEIGPCWEKGHPSFLGCPTTTPPGASCIIDGFAQVQDYYRTSSASEKERGLAVAALTLTVCSHKSVSYCLPSTLSESSLAEASRAVVPRTGRSSFSFDLAAQPIRGRAAEQVPRP